MKAFVKFGFLRFLGFYVSVSAILYCDVWLLLVPLLCIIEK